MKPDDKDQVHDHVQDSCDKQIHQRPFGVTPGTHNAVAEIVKSHGRHTQRINLKVIDRTLHQLVLRMQKSKERSGAGQADHTDQKSGHKADQKRGMDRLLCLFLVSGSQAMGHADIHSGAHANKESGKQRHQKTCGAHRSQCPVIRKAPYNSHIA